MDKIEEAMIQEGVLARRERIDSGIREARSGLAALRRRLERLVKLQSLLKDKYRSRLADLYTQLGSIERQQRELTGLAKQFKKHRERRSIIKRQIAGLERRKKIIGQAIKQVIGYERSSNAHVEAMEDEQEILSQRISDLENVIELAEQAELSGDELGVVARRISTTQNLLREYEMDLSKRTIDLLFEFYIPPSTARRRKP
jgi:chromosome segregation ATPase